MRKTAEQNTFENPFKVATFNKSSPDFQMEKETVKYTPADIQRTVISFGSNKNMLDVYILGLTDKGLYKEAAYAAKVFDALNNINFD